MILFFGKLNYEKFKKYGIKNEFLEDIIINGIKINNLEK